uniref:Uncharacterized protein n=1 Tax=Arundo donax TaxID=35708 RepID=A0A0A8ZB45_ARUDO
MANYRSGYISEVV